ncbi:MAG: uroporphyrinogen decarboxylase family protein [Spirochaetota bacterium]
MTSRERLLLAASHREADRVPVDFGATRSGGISAIAYNAVKKWLGLPAGETRMYDIQQQLAWPDDQLLDRYGIDVIDAGRAFLVSPSDWVPFPLNDGGPALVPAYHDCRPASNGAFSLHTRRGTAAGLKSASSYYFDQTHWPWQALPGIPDPVHAEDFEEQLWAIPSSPFHLDIMNKGADRKLFSDTLRAFHQATDRAVLLDFGVAGFFEAPGYMRGLENWFCDMVADEAGTDRALAAYTEMCIERLDVILGAAGDSIDVLRLFWDDMGNQNTTQLSPDLFKRTFAPHYRQLIDHIHAKSACRILVHSCGSIYRIIPHLIDAGVEMLNPIQTSCDEMDPERLKREFGKDLVFWGGGCDTVTVLTSGTPAEIRDAVRRRMDILAPGGGFVFVQTHNIQPGVPAENVVAMLEAAREYGGY